MGLNEIKEEDSKHLQRIAEDFVKERLIYGLVLVYPKGRNYIEGM
jgi:hypothetical protein